LFIFETNNRDFIYCCTITTQSALAAVIWSPQGQTGLEAKILVSALALDSSIWPWSC